MEDKVGSLTTILRRLTAMEGENARKIFLLCPLGHRRLGRRILLRLMATEDKQARWVMVKFFK